MISGHSKPGGVQRATVKDLDMVVEVLVDSHVDYVWERWALPWGDRGQRLEGLYMSMLRWLALPAGEVWMSRCGQSAAVWLPAGADQDRGPEAIAQLETATVAAFGDRLQIIGEIDEIIATQRPPAAWILATMGTSPMAQGRGLGTEVLKPRLAALDADGARAVLETSDRRNLGFYERLGFVVVAELDELPHDAPTTWIMERTT